MKDSFLGSSRHKPNQEYSSLKHPTAHLGGPTHVKASCLTGPIQWHTYQPAQDLAAEHRRRPEEQSAMAFTMRAVKVPPNSASLEEARHRVFDFFKQACRSIPTIMEIYNLEDVVTPTQLRSSIAQQIRWNQEITNPKVRSLPTHFSAPHSLVSIDL
jgi:hypothetical protein